MKILLRSGQVLWVKMAVRFRELDEQLELFRDESDHILDVPLAEIITYWYDNEDVEVVK